MMTKQKKAYKILLIVLLWVIAAFHMFPMLIVLIEPFKTKAEILRSPFSLPKSITLTNFAEAIKAIDFPRAAFNSIFITVVSVILIVLFSSMTAYAIARRNNRFYNFLYLTFLGGMIVPFQMTMLPLYKTIHAFDLMNTHRGIILIYVSTGVVFPIFLLAGFIKAVPKELEEAAKIDGCGLYSTFFRIVFPLLKPALATVTILATFGIWNDFMIPLLFLTTKEKRTIVVRIYDFMGMYASDWNLIFATIFLVVFPMVILYLYAQKFIISGITTGAVKG